MACQYSDAYAGADARSGAGTAAAAGRAKPAAAKPPRLECEQGRKWVVENHVDNHGIVISDTDPRQAIYIYGCRNSTVQARI